MCVCCVCVHYRSLHIYNSFFVCACFGQFAGIFVVVTAEAMKLKRQEELLRASEAGECQWSYR